MIYVVGSGPAGISCAFALLKQGLQVTMLDAGIVLEPDRRRLIEGLQNSSPESWNKESLTFLKQNTTPSHRGIPTKFAYGSDFPYREADKFIPLQKRNADPIASLARGGLSNVWGSNVLPFLSHDIEAWPISTNDLAPHYETVLSFLNISAVRDDLADIFPLHADKYQTLYPSNQASALLEDLKKNRAKLNSRGVFFGLSRLAVQAESDHNKPGCVYCGLCMYGCPYELIYNSSFTLRELLRDKRFKYMDNVVVHKVRESNGAVQIKGESRDRGEAVAFSGTRVYLACGVLSTTQILLESLEAFNTPLKLLDSQYFLFPLIRYKGIKNVDKEKLHTLCQVYIELFDPSISRNAIMLEVYTYNDLYKTALETMLGPLSSLLKFPINEVLGRLLIVMGYLHSDVSPYISVRLAERRAAKHNTLILEGQDNNGNTTNVIKSVIKKMSDSKSLLRAFPISSFLQIAEPGRSFHCGGTFPMRERPGAFETDILGRPSGFKKVHVVDSTVFPSVPATTITLTVMANAHRIGSAFSES